VNRVVLYGLLILLAGATCLAQNPPAGQSSAMPAAADSGLHGTIPASLAKSIDSKKLKEGDEVDAKTVHMMRTADGVMIPTGSKIAGHVTQVKSRSKGDSESSLGIAFDKIQLTGGKELPIKGVLQAVGPNPSESSGPDTGAAGGNNMNAGGGSAGTMSTPTSGTDAMRTQQAGMAGAGGKMLTPQSTGAVGIKNLTLDNSVLSSTGKDVKLDMGAQLMIKAE